MHGFLRPAIVTALMALGGEAWAQAPEVRIIVGGEVAPLLAARGRTYVEARKGEEYEIEITNPTDARIAVAVSVDGLNSFDAARVSSAAARKWIVMPGGKVRVRGWQIDKDSLRRFVFTSEAQSLGAKLGRTDNLGLISVAAFREKVPQVAMRAKNTSRSGPVSMSAPGKASSVGGAGGVAGVAPMRVYERRQKDEEQAATGQGRVDAHRVTFVSMDLEATPFFVQDVRYEFRAGLVRLGVDRREQATGFEPVRYAPNLP